MRKFFDLHNDFLSELKNDKVRGKYLNKYASSNEIVSAVWTSEMESDEAIKSVEKGFEFVNKNNGKIDEKYGLFLRLGIEDMHFVSKNNLSRVINCSPDYCTLTWNYQNALGGGAVEGGDLTVLGIDVVRELEKNNIFVDTAHLCEKSFMSFSNINENPILCSHTAVFTLQNNPRNLKDYQIRMIVESGGLMGIAFVSQFLSGQKKSTISDIARHIDYIVSRYGDDNICLGTDFFGTKNTPRGMKSYASLPALEERLKFLGYSDETIDKIFFDNAKRFFSQKNMPQ